MNTTGTELGEWSYEYKEIPLYNRLLIADTTIIPVTYMMLYQYCKTWKSFIVSHVVMAVLFAFIGEPLLEWLNIYHPNGWRHIYSFPIYICIGIVMRWLIMSIKSIQDKNDS